jgi:hypothetical protein
VQASKTETAETGTDSLSEVKKDDSKVEKQKKKKPRQILSDSESEISSDASSKSEKSSAKAESKEIDVSAKLSEKGDSKKDKKPKKERDNKKVEDVEKKTEDKAEVKKPAEEKAKVDKVSVDKTVKVNPAKTEAPLFSVSAKTELATVPKVELTPMSKPEPTLASNSGSVKCKNRELIPLLERFASQVGAAPMEGDRDDKEKEEKEKPKDGCVSILSKMEELASEDSMVS